MILAEYGIRAVISQTSIVSWYHSKMIHATYKLVVQMILAEYGTSRSNAYRCKKEKEKEEGNLVLLIDAPLITSNG